MSVCSLWSTVFGSSVGGHRTGRLQPAGAGFVVVQGDGHLTDSRREVFSRSASFTLSTGRRRGGAPFRHGIDDDLAVGGLPHFKGDPRKAPDQ